MIKTTSYLLVDITDLFLFHSSFRTEYSNNVEHLSLVGKRERMFITSDGHFLQGAWVLSW